jgi:hypothetical protein
LEYIAQRVDDVPTRLTSGAQYLPSKDQHHDPPSKVNHWAQGEAGYAGDHPNGVSCAEPKKGD